MPVIDSHIHVWDRSVNRYDWLDAEPVLNRQFLPGDIDRGASSVTGMIFVQAGAEDGLAEARWVDSLAPQWPELVGIVAQARLELGSAVAPHLEAVCRIPRVVGVRRLLQDEPVEFDLPGLAAGLRETAAAGLTFDACIRHQQLPALTALLHEVPELPVVLDHLGKPPVASGEIDGWRADLAALAENPRVAVKLSGMAPEAGNIRPLAEQALPYLEAALEIFGPARCMVASDWPVSALLGQPIPYDEWFALVLDGLGLTAAERERVEWRTAASFYRLDENALRPEGTD